MDWAKVLPLLVVCSTALVICRSGLLTTQAKSGCWPACPMSLGSVDYKYVASGDYYTVATVIWPWSMLMELVLCSGFWACIP